MHVALNKYNNRDKLGFFFLVYYLHLCNNPFEGMHQYIFSLLITFPNNGITPINNISHLPAYVNRNMFILIKLK